MLACCYPSLLILGGGYIAIAFVVGQVGESGADRIKDWRSGANR
jgi:hypothetical protein